MTESTGLVERLRFDAARCEIQFSKGVATNIEEAAAAIEQLQAALLTAEAQRDGALEALLPFVAALDRAETLEPLNHDMRVITCREHVTLYEFARARAAASAIRAAKLKGDEVSDKP